LIAVFVGSGVVKERLQKSILNFTTYIIFRIFLHDQRWR